MSKSKPTLSKLNTSTENVSRWQSDSYGGSEKLELVKDIKLRSLAIDEVLVKVLATTATYTDQLIIRGNYLPSPPLPVTPGYDCVGNHYLFDTIIIIDIIIVDIIIIIIIIVHYPLIIFSIPSS